MTSLFVLVIYRRIDFPNMAKRPLLNFCLAVLLGILLLASQSTARLLDRSVPHDSIAKLQGTNFLSLFRREDDLLLHKRVDLNTLYNAVPGGNKVSLGATRYFELDLTRSDTYTTAYFYGCTVVIVVYGQGLTIGHYAQEQAKPGTNGQASCIAMTDRTLVENNIIERLVEETLMADYTADTRAWIITSSGTGTIGYNLIREYFEENDMLAGNIIPFAYTATSAFTNFESGPIGKAVVEVVPKKDGSGATINVYIQSDTPSWSGNYDASGRLVPTRK